MITARLRRQLDDAKDGDTVRVSAEVIRLDPENPRLTEEDSLLDQDRLLETLIRRFKLDGLARSIVASGFLEYDPMVGLWDGETVTVLEGNRRVAAAKLLLDPALAPRNRQPKWRELARGLKAQYRQQLEKLPLEIYSNRDAFDVLAYVGFRHVSGVIQWPALEKAAFMARLVRKDWTYREIANRLGSYPKHVERHYIAHQVTRQAADLRLPGHERMRSTFGVLLRALQSTHIQEFLGIEYPGNPEKSENPVPRNCLRGFQDFVAWTFGTEDSRRILRDSRDLTMWGKILTSADAIGYLRRSKAPKFERAWRRTGGEGESIVDALLTAADRLEESVPLVGRYKRDKTVLRAVGECADFIAQILAKFPKIRDKYFSHE